MSASNIILYHNPRCSKSRQTLELLQQKNIEPTLIDYMQDPPDVETLQKICNLMGLPVRSLLRTNEQVYKDAGLDDSDLTDDEILDALSQCPTLLQRPILVVDDKKAALGRPPEKVLEII
jgi:arsenate reductase